MTIPTKATPPTIIPAIAPRPRLGAEGESPDGAAVIQMAREVLEDVELVVVVLVVSKNLAVEVRARNVDPVVVLSLSLVEVAWKAVEVAVRFVDLKVGERTGRVKTAAMFSSGWASRNPIT